MCVGEQIEIRSLVNSAFEHRRSIEPNCSLRKFAKTIKVHPAALSEFLNGKRNFSKKMALRIAKELVLNPEEINRIESMYSDTAEKDALEVEKLRLQEDLYFLYSDPLYFSLLCLIETHDFVNDIEWMSKRLKTTKRKAKKALKILFELNLVKEENEKLIPIPEVIGSFDNIPNQSLRKRHTQNMNDSIEAIEQLSVDDRYFGFETLAFDPRDLDLVQKKINLLFDELIHLSQRARSKDEVYEFTMGYFPRTELNKK